MQNFNSHFCELKSSLENEWNEHQLVHTSDSNCNCYTGLGPGAGVRAGAGAAGGVGGGVGEGSRRTPAAGKAPVRTVHHPPKAGRLIPREPTISDDMHCATGAERRHVDWAVVSYATSSPSSDVPHRRREIGCDGRELVDISSSGVLGEPGLSSDTPAPSSSGSASTGGSKHPLPELPLLKPIIKRNQNESRCWVNFYCPKTKFGAR